MEPAEGTTVWVSTVPGTKTDYENIPYTYEKRGNELLLLADREPIYYQSPDQVIFNAGTHFSGTAGTNSSEYVSLTDQSDLAGIDYFVSLNEDPDDWKRPLRKGSLDNPLVDHVFGSKLAKIRLLIDASEWDKNAQLTATAHSVPAGYRCGSELEGNIVASSDTGNINLRMTDLGNGAWLAEGLFVPGTIPSIALTTKPGEIAYLELKNALYFDPDKFSEGTTYAAEVSIASNGNTTIGEHKAVEQEVWRTTWYDGLFSEFITGDLAPATVCGSPVTMDGPTSWGIHQDTPLRGKVTLAPDAVEVRMQDLYFTSPDGETERVRFKKGDNVFEFANPGTGNVFFEYKERTANFQVEGSTKWTTEPVPLAPGETKTVMIRLGMEHRYYYYSLDITRPKVEISSQPQDAIVDEGSPATFQVATTGTEGVTYQWQASIDGATWKDVDGADKATLSLDATTMGMDGAQYRCLVTIPSGASSSKTIVSSVATLHMNHIHNVSGTWSSDASGHWHACTGCSEKLDFAAHAKTTVGAKEPTCTEDGNTGETTCIICGAMLATSETVPATGHSFQNGSCVSCGAKDPAYEIPPAPTPEPDPEPKPDPEPGPGGTPNPHPGSQPNPDSGTDIQPDSKSTPNPGLPATGDTSPLLMGLTCLAGASALVIARAIYRRDNA